MFKLFDKVYYHVAIPDTFYIGAIGIESGTIYGITTKTEYIDGCVVDTINYSVGKNSNKLVATPYVFATILEANNSLDICVKTRMAELTKILDTYKYYLQIRSIHNNEI